MQTWMLKMDDEVKLIRCLMDMLSRNSLCEYTLNERLITKRMFRDIISIQENDPIFYNIVRQKTKADVIEVLQFIFSDGTITFGRIIAAYGFTKCCFQGTVSLPPLQIPSQNAVELFSGYTAQSHQFLENIRQYNATIAIASWNATVTEHAGRSPRVVTSHGQAYHLTASQEAPVARPPQYAQLYILDANDALQQRVTDPRNENLQADIIQLLQDELLAVNPYARQYQNMGQCHQRENSDNFHHMLSSGKMKFISLSFSFVRQFLTLANSSD